MPEDHLPAIIRSRAPAELRRELALAEGYAASALAPSTRKAYEHDWLVFASWCAEHGAQAVPAVPATVAAFLASEADRGFRPVTIGRRAAAIAAAHRAQDRPNPCDSGAVAAVMSGIRRQHGTRPLRRAAPLELDPLARLLEPIDTATLAGQRDRAMVLLGFAAALRRSELVALDVEDLEFDTARGLKIVIRGSKTDQERAGATVAVPYAHASGRCAVRALQVWLAAASIHRGPVFRQMRRGDTLTDQRLSDQSVALIVKRHAQRIGLDPSRFAGHSLRAGFATSAALAGVDALEIARQTGHKSLSMVQRYTRPATIWHMNAAQRVGL